MQTLASLCDLVSEQIDPSTTPGALYVGLEHLAPGRLMRSGGGLGAEVQSHKFLFRKGDILYGKLRPYLDKAVLADSDGVCTTELLVLRPRPGIDPLFLACVVHDSDFINHAMAGVTGAHHPRTSWSHISEFPVLDVDKDEQGKIAKLLWRIHDLLGASESTLESAGKLKRAAMRELFTRGLRADAQKETDIGLIPANWDVKFFADVREWLQYGTSTRCSLNTATYPVLRIPNVEAGRVNTANLKYCDLPKSEADKYLLEKGDLLFIRTNGVLERLGCTAVYKGNPDRALFASYLIRARLKKDVDARYVAFFYGSEIGTSLVAGRATPASDGKYNLNTGTIDALPLPLPPTIDEQLEIVSVLEAIERKIELHQEKTLLLENLFKALLHKLMSGEIGVNNLDISALDKKPSSERAAA